MIFNIYKIYLNLNIFISKLIKNFKNKNQAMDDDIYNYYEESQDENFKMNDKFNKNLIKINSTTMRISVLEDRTKSLEKMLRLFEERMNLKEEEKANDLKGIEANSNLINKLNKKIKYLEKQLTDFIAQKQISDQENEKKIEKLNERIQFLETQIKNGQNANNDLNEKEFSLNEKSSNIIMNDFNELIKSNNLQMDEFIQEKIYNSNVDNENKINELLNLIQEINKIVEENENQISLLNTNFNKFQNDNVNVIQMISIQEEKINSIDFVNEEIKKLKLKLNEFASYFEDKNEEEKFTKEFLNSVRIK
jgi:chromosome segregation ATPase